MKISYLVVYNKSQIRKSPLFFPKAYNTFPLLVTKYLWAMTEATSSPYLHYLPGYLLPLHRFILLKPSAILGNFSSHGLDMDIDSSHFDMGNWV